MEHRATTKKQEVLALLSDMPDELDLEELQYRLYVLQKIQQGEAAFQAGDVVMQEEVERQSKEWQR